MQRNRPAARRTRARASILAVAVVLAGLPTTAAAQSVPGATTDGRSPATAAASCYEIKQVTPSAPSGVYWLRTPSLIAPQRFYCDQTTDGGGWVLVGRGREGWQTRYEGLGDAEQVHTPHTGPEAFQPRQLPSRTIDALLDGGRVDALSDGIRLRRARNSNGTSWQEARVQFEQRDRWVWTFPARHPLAWWSFDGWRGTGGSSHDWGSTSSLLSERRVITPRAENQNWTHGFAYGNSISGQSNSTTYLWSASNGRGNARPFTQVYLRPRLRTATLAYPAIADGGTPTSEQSWLPESRALPATWGVTGLANGRSGELNTEVQDFAQVGDRVFVGGNFRSVRNHSTGQSTEQSYLAAFDVGTGAWISGFRPTFNGQIKALAALPDGRLAVGGEFDRVNGEVHAGAVVLDATTGAVEPGFDLQVENRISAGVLSVRSLSVQDDWLYLGGSFTHLTGGSDQNPVHAQHTGRVSVADGTPDRGWNPWFRGTVVAIDASERGDRVYAAGYFENMGADATRAYRAAIISTSAGAAQDVAWEPNYSAGHRQNYQQAVREVDDRVWLGGAEHSLFSFDRGAPNTRLSSNITNPNGDFQTISSANGVVFAGCHCDDWNYSGATGWPNQQQVIGPWFQADKIGWLAAWDADTSAVIPDFNPVMNTRAGHGAWASFIDSRDVLWVGGDFTAALRPGDANQTVSGFVRFPERDDSAPTTPGSASITTVAGTLTASWTPSTDDGGAVTYEVLRDDRVIAVTSSTSVELPDGPEGARYFVRAVDTAGNRSASTARLSAPAPEDPSLPRIEEGSTWRWRFQQGGTVPDGWRQPGFDAGSWSVGAAPLGFGSDVIATNIDVAGGSANRPLSALFRHDFNVEDPTAVGTVTVSTYADDGVAVFVNGTEVGRTNLPTGNLTLNSYATAAPSTAAARANPVTYTVPAGLLREGVNTVAAQTHVNYRSTPSVSFDLALTATPVDPDAPPPAAPSLTATATAPDTVELTWPAAAPGTVSRYRIERDGALVADLDGAVTRFVDEGLVPDADYSYQIVAVGTSGAVSAPGVATVRTPVEPGAPLLAEGAQWQWRFEQGDAPTSDWREPGFDAGSWSSGVAPLGFGSTTVATDIDVTGGSSNRPLSAQFRRDVAIDDLDEVASLTITTYADDGVVVFVNGTEVGRTNLPTGTLTANSYATAAPRTAAARGNPASYTVPRALLREGTNTIAAQTHLNYRSTPDLSFDLSAIVVEADPDAEPPARPNLTATAAGPTTVELGWVQPAGNDVAAYRIERDGDLVAVVASEVTAYTDEGLEGETTYRYSVVAVGTAGAASSPATASVTTAPSPLIAAGSTWQWLYQRDGDTAVPADWRETGFDASGWPSGSAPLGFGSDPTMFSTNIDVAAGQRPLSALFRRDLTIDDLDEVGTLELTTWADDGVVVYVNGQRVGQSNMAGDPPSAGAPYPLDRYALNEPRTATARTQPVTFPVPAGLLREGSNTIAVQTHLNYRTTRDLSFDLVATVVPPDPDADAPDAPALAASVTGPTSVELTWDHAHSSDVIGYRIERDGQFVTTVPAPGSSYTDTGLSPGTAYVYEVFAVAAGNARSAPASAGVTTEAAPVLAAGSDWRWRFAQGGDVPQDWYASGYDTASWSSGAAPLGFGSSTVATDIDVAGGTGNRPLAALFQRTFEVASTAPLEVTTWADDGVVVYVNGTEIGRRNLPTGPVSFATYATAAPRTPAALSAPAIWTVPASVLVAGTNTVSAQVHVNYRSTPDLSFELSVRPAAG